MIPATSWDSPATNLRVGIRFDLVDAHIWS